MWRNKFKIDRLVSMKSYREPQSLVKCMEVKLLKSFHFWMLVISFKLVSSYCFTFSWKYLTMMNHLLGCNTNCSTKMLPLIGLEWKFTVNKRPHTFQSIHFPWKWWKAESCSHTLFEAFVPHKCLGNICWRRFYVKN